MTGQDIFAALGELDERLIDEAAAPPQASARRRWQWQSAGLIAACLCLAVLGYGYLNGPDFIGSSGSSGSSADESITETAAAETEMTAAAEANGDAGMYEGAEAPVVTAAIDDGSDTSESSADAGDGETDAAEADGSEDTDTGSDWDTGTSAAGKTYGSTQPTESMEVVLPGESVTPSAAPTESAAPTTTPDRSTAGSEPTESPELPEPEGVREQISGYTDSDGAAPLPEGTAPENGSCLLAQNVQQALLAYSGENVEFVLRLQVYSDGTALSGTALESEYQRLEELGYRLYQTEAAVVVGVFTQQELEQFEEAAAGSEYGYRLSFVQDDLSGEWSGTLAPLED